MVEMIDAFFIMLRNVLVFVLLAIPGFLLVKLGFIKAKESGILSKLLTYVGMPFLILASTLNVSSDGNFTKNIIIVGIFGVIFTVGIFFLSACLVGKGNENKKRRHFNLKRRRRARKSQGVVLYAFYFLAKKILTRNTSFVIMQGKSLIGVKK